MREYHAPGSHRSPNNTPCYPSVPQIIRPIFEKLIGMRPSRSTHESELDDDEDLEYPKAKKKNKIN